MKQITTLILITAISLVSLAQSNSFNYNQAQFNFDNDGSFFNSQLLGVGGYFPEGTEQSILHFVGLHFGAKHQDTNIRRVSTNYVDKLLRPGPFANNYQDSLYQVRFNESIWIVTKSQVETHKVSFWDPFYETPDVIKNWPGNGNVSNGESSILAPFEDVNNNGVYEPQFGDYPCIKGDKCAYLMMNDQQVDTLGNVRMDVEVHLMFYQFLWPEVINQTTFFNVNLINKSDRIYTDLKTGLLMDFDIGTPMNDYVGTDSIRDIFYGYNGVLSDTVNASSFAHFGENPPAAGIKVLNDDLSSTNYANPFANNVQIGWGWDGEIIPFYELMCGEFWNGHHLTYGGWGFDPLNPETDFIYSGYRESGWTESGENHPVGDRRGMMTVYKNELLPNESVSYDFAVVYRRPENPDDIWDAVDVMFENADIVQEFYDNMDQSCQNETADILEFKELEFQVYPNPANDEVFVQLNGSFEVEVYNVFGKQVVQKLKGFQQEKIDLSHCAAGVYFVKVMQDGHSSIKKLILK